MPLGGAPTELDLAAPAPELAFETVDDAWLCDPFAIATTASHDLNNDLREAVIYSRSLQPHNNGEQRSKSLKPYQQQEEEEEQEKEHVKKKKKCRNTWRREDDGKAV